MIAIDCQTCKLEGGMMATRVAKFSGFIQFIGGLIALPSFFGMLVGAIAVFNSFSGNAPGTANGLGFIFGVGIFCTAAVGGLIGWLLVMRKKVFKCSRCGFILDRA